MLDKTQTFIPMEQVFGSSSSKLPFKYRAQTLKIGKRACIQ